MRILVTGGAGFIGANFLNRQVPRHPECEFLNLDLLTYAGNLESLAALDGASNYHFERGDIANRDDVDRVFRRFEPDVVVHLAAESHVDRSIVESGRFISTNVQGTHHLLEAARESRGAAEGGLFLHVSTDEVYGSLGPEGRFVESSRYDPSSPYSASKAASDHLVRAYARTYGLRTRITNCSNNYGPFQFPEKLIPLMILRAVAREPLPVYGDGGHARDWLFVEDHVEALWAVIEKGVDGETYNLGGDAERTNLEVVTRICREVARRTGADPDELERLVTFVPDRPGHDRRYSVDASKARRSIAWQPRHTFETGLAKTVDWYLANEDWLRHVQSGEYRDWIRLNYSERAD